MQIFEANKGSLSDPNLIRIGQKLRILSLGNDPQTYGCRLMALRIQSGSA